MRKWVDVNLGGLAAVLWLEVWNVWLLATTVALVLVTASELLRQLVQYRASVLDHRARRYAESLRAARAAWSCQNTRLDDDWEPPRGT